MDTLTVAQYLGPIWLLAGLGMFLNKKYYQKMIEEWVKEKGLTHIAGSMLLLLGLIVVLNHSNAWELSATGLVTLVGWAATLKGAALLIIPEQMLGIAKTVKGSAHINIGAAISVAAGGYLTYLAYFAV